MQRVFHDLFSSVTTCGPFEVKYPNGDVVLYGAKPEPAAPRFRLIFKNKKSMLQVLTGIDLGFGEAYMFGDIEVEGNLSDLMEVAMAPGGLEEATLRFAYRPSFILRHPMSSSDSPGLSINFLHT